MALDHLDDVDIVILIPALNEERAIGQTLDEIQIQAETIVIDNGSTDKTAELAKKGGATVLTETRRGYGYACLKGIEYIKNRQKETVVVFLDGDGADDPREITRLLKIFLHRKSPDIVMGARLERLEAGAMSPHAILANRIFVAIINLLYKVKLSDMGPLRVMNLNTLLDIGMKDTGYGWTSEMIVKALNKNYTIGEVPVVYRARLGESKISGSLITSLKAAIWITIHIFRHAVWRE